MAGNKKFEEGQELIKQAEKSLKTSFLKWRPDFDEAADHYNKAATCFRNARAFEQCKECLLKAADCHVQNRGLFYAGKALDQAVLISKELGNLTDIQRLAMKAADYYQTQGSLETAVASLDRGAKILESSNLDETLLLYERAADISLSQDNNRQGAEYLNKIARIFIKLKKYELAADNIRREISIYMENDSFQAAGRSAVGLVLVQLARGDLVAAEKAYREWGNCCEPAEIQNIERLLQAYDEEDPELAKNALNDPFIKHMDIEFALLARDMPLPEPLVASAPRPGVRENATEAYVSVKNTVTAEIEDQTEDLSLSKGDDVKTTPEKKEETAKNNEKEEEEDEEDEGLC